MQYGVLTRSENYMTLSELLYTMRQLIRENKKLGWINSLSHEFKEIHVVASESLFFFLILECKRLVQALYSIICHYSILGNILLISYLLSPTALLGRHRNEVCPSVRLSVCPSVRPSVCPALLSRPLLSSH